MSLRPETICLIDDEPSVLKALGRLLASEGFHAMKFDDPVLFIRHATCNPVHLAVIDIRMPGMSGLEVMEKLSTISPTTRTIVITGEGDPMSRAAAMSAGAVFFFPKPFDDEALLQAIRATISNHGRDGGEGGADASKVR